jgi:uncharacterized protein involved in exopolysaccharide biosynthesis
VANIQFSNLQKYWVRSQNADEVFLVILKRKWIIIGFLLVSILIALLKAELIKPPNIYESSATIEVGIIGGTIRYMIEDPRLIVERISRSTMSASTLQKASVYSISVDKTHEAKIEIVVRGESKKDVEHFLKSTVKKVLIEHKYKFDEINIPRLELLTTLVQQRNVVKQKLNEFDKIIAISNDMSRKFDLSVEKMNLTFMLIDIDQKITEVRLLISGINSRPTKLLRETAALTIQNNNTKYQLVISGMIGLVFGLFFAFGVDYFNYLKKNSQE